MSDSLQPHGLYLPSSSVHGILQARIVGWVAISSSRGSFRPRDRIQVSCTAGRFFTVRATREAKVVCYSSLFNFYLRSLFCSRTPWRIPDYMDSSCLLWILLTLSFLVLVFDNDDSFEYWPVLCKMTLNCVFFFPLILRVGLWVLGKKTAEVKGHLHSRPSRVHLSPWSLSLLILTLITWLQQCLSAFSKWRSFPPFHRVLFGRKSLCTAHTWGKGSNCPNPHKLRGIFLHEGLSVFLYLFIESCIYIGVCSGSFTVKSNMALFRWSTCHLWPLALGPLHQPRHGVLLCLLNPSSLSGTKRCSRF